MLTVSSQYSTWDLRFLHYHNEDTVLTVASSGTEFLRRILRGLNTSSLVCSRNSLPHRISLVYLARVKFEKDFLHHIHYFFTTSFEVSTLTISSLYLLGVSTLTISSLDPRFFKQFLRAFNVDGFFTRIMAATKFHYSMLTIASSVHADFLTKFYQDSMLRVHSIGTRFSHKILRWLHVDNFSPNFLTKYYYNSILSTVASWESSLDTEFLHWIPWWLNIDGFFTEFFTRHRISSVQRLNVNNSFTQNSSIDIKFLH